jgi:hypothetical protein
MSSLENYKTAMSPGLKKFFEEYEVSLKELVEKLNSEGLFFKSFSEEQVTRLQNITKSCNMSFKLLNDLHSLFPLDMEKQKEKLEHIKKAFNTENGNRIAEHFGISLTTNYVVFLEKLKIYFLFFIDWKKLDKDSEKIYGLGTAINILKKKYPDNKFLDYFNTGARNSFTHYTFYWLPGGKVKLCSNLFDKTPEEISLTDLMKEIYNLNVLVEGFYMAIADKFELPEITPERMER